METTNFEFTESEVDLLVQLLCIFLTDKNLSLNIRTKVLYIIDTISKANTPITNRVLTTITKRNLREAIK